MKRAGILLAIGCALSLRAQDDAQRFDASPLARLPLSETQRKQVAEAIGRHEYKRAEQILVDQINASPKSAELLAFAARLFLFDRDPANAAIAFAKAEKISPLQPSDRLSLALAYLGIGRREWARPELTKLATEEPDNPRVQYWLARVDYDDQLYDSAIQRLEKVARAQPDFVRAWDFLALSQEGAGRLDDALASYARAVELNRKSGQPSPWPPLNMGILLTKLDRIQDAEPLLREAVQRDPTLAAAQYRLGVNLQKQHKADEAKAVLLRAMELNPRDPAPLYPLSQIYRAQGDAAAANDALRRFQELRKAKNGA